MNVMGFLLYELYFVIENTYTNIFYTNQMIDYQLLVRKFKKMAGDFWRDVYGIVWV